VAGLLASITTQPADVVKTSVQLKAADTGLVQAAYSICQKTGFRGMFAGILPRVTRRTLMAAFTWSFYEQIVMLIENRSDRFH
jgi:solute carrier family 25 protein 38